MDSQVSLFIKELEDLEKNILQSQSPHTVYFIFYNMEINRVLLAKFPFEDV